MAYAGEWRERRGRKRLFLLALWGGWLTAGALVVLFRLGVAAGLAVGLAWVGITVWAGWRLFSWPCPRCKRPFLLDLPARSNPSAKRCLHCGLPLGAERDPGEVPEWIREKEKR